MYFNTKEEALRYKDVNNIYNKVVKFIQCREKWALVFDIDGAVCLTATIIKDRPNDTD